MTAADLANLIGLRVTVTWPEGDARAAGVLLPPVAEGGHLRVHTDSGPVLEVVPGACLIGREQPEDPRSRRVTICPVGRPVYRHADLPALQLATTTMLGRGRRRPAAGQQPIASYLVRGPKCGYRPLFAVADSVALKALSAERHAEYEKARTCARCQVRQADPFARPYAEAPDGARYCRACWEPAMRELRVATWTAARQECTAWAKDVLGDPTALLVVSTAALASQLRVETVAGQVLISTLVMPQLDTFDWEYMAATDRPSRDAYTEPADLAPQLQALAGRRLISAAGTLQLLNGLMRHDLAEPLQVRDGDVFHDRWAAWQAGPSGRPRRPDEIALPNDAAACMALIRSGLEAMAAEDSEGRSGDAS